MNNKSNKKIKKALYFTCTIIVLLIITYLSVIPGGGPSPQNIPGFVKHLVAYTVFGFFVYKTIENKPIAFIMVGIYGLAMEFVQLYIPTRCFDIFDILADYLGALSIFFIIKIKKND